MIEEKPNKSPHVLPSALLRMTTDVVAAYVRNNILPTTQLPQVISMVHASLVLAEAKAPVPATGDLKPAVPIRKSVTDAYLVCLEDGRRLKMLKRHLRASYGMSPDEYRRKWGLPGDYPMVAPNYAKQRSAFAKKIRLGRGRGPRTPLAPVVS